MTQGLSTAIGKPSTVGMAAIPVGVLVTVGMLATDERCGRGAPLFISEFPNRLRSSCAFSGQNRA